MLAWGSFCLIGLSLARLLTTTESRKGVAWMLAAAAVLRPGVCPRPRFLRQDAWQLQTCAVAAQNDRVAAPFRKSAFNTRLDRSHRAGDVCPHRRDQGAHLLVLADGLPLPGLPG